MGDQTQLKPQHPMSSQAPTVAIGTISSIPPAAATVHGSGMAAWAAAQGLKYSSKVDFFAPGAKEGSGFGAVALEAIAVGETLLEISPKHCLTPLHADGMPDFMDEQQKLMLRLLQEVLVVRDVSAWSPYLHTLPREFPSLPLWFSEGELQMLKGTSVDTLLAGPHIANESDLADILAWCERREDMFPPDVKLGIGDLRWAASVVASRSFDSVAFGVALVPFGDALNHVGDQPHTRMREREDGTMIFTADRSICSGEEIFNCYGEHDNVQWLLNGGFVEVANAHEDLPVPPTEAVNAVLAYKHRQLKQTVPDDGEGSDELESNVCARLAFLQQAGVYGDDVFRVCSRELLPDDLATLVLVLCMKDNEFSTFRQRPLGGHLIDLTVERFPEDLLADMYRCLLLLADLVESRYETSLEDDEGSLAQLEESAAADSPGERPKKYLKRGWPSDLETEQRVRPENARNILLLRTGQKRILRKLREASQECFASDGEEFAEMPCVPQCTV